MAFKRTIFYGCTRTMAFSDPNDIHLTDKEFGLKHVGPLPPLDAFGVVCGVIGIMFQLACVATFVYLSYRFFSR